MTLFFDWEKLHKKANKDPVKCISLLSDYYDRKVAKLPLTLNLQGSSFLLSPSEIFQDKVTDILYVYQYLKLAALRDYALFKLYGVKSLQLSYYPEINIRSIRHNPLLKVTNQEIYFKYEENNYGTKIR